MEACINNHQKACAELLRRGADTNIKAGGKTALHHAVIHGYPNLVEMLLRHGARTDIRVDVDESDFTDHDGCTALQIAEAELGQRGGGKPRFSEIANMLRQYSR
uniref:Uncharacterized protein n=1 Tax=Haptolina brevifila TaxID=156173 RepID=A0A7S2G5L5_9EUKA